ncbi:MAG: TrkA family potassium uptake protein [Candidatus Glassbacteria bacterium]|nr:TrkA family potassium uptake protein [Candidatus Glassbacteria bacterium]
MKKFIVIGLGNFGFQVARSLFELGHEVVAVDSQKDRVQQISDYCTRAVIADAEDQEFLRSAGAAEMDAVVVSLGDNISQSIIIVLFLKELKARYVIAKANDPNHGKALRRVGADRVVFPEQEMAVKLAHKLSSPSVIDSLDLSEGYVITELLAPLGMVGKSLVELDLRKIYKVFVMAIREAVPERVLVLPPAEYRIKDSDVLVLLGSDEDIARLEKKMRKAEE